MPDAPPCGDNEHTTVLQFGWEDVGVEQEDQSEARVLDTHLDGDSTTVRTGALNLCKIRISLSM